MANAANGAGLCLLMLGRPDEAREWLARAAERYRESFEDAPPDSWGRPIGAVKARLLAGDEAGAEEDARWALELGAADAESPIGRYAAALALLVLARDEEARAVAETIRERDDFPPTSPTRSPRWPPRTGSATCSPSRACSSRSRPGTSTSRTWTRPRAPPRGRRAGGQHHVDLDRRIAAAVQDLPRVHRLDVAHCLLDPSLVIGPPLRGAPRLGIPPDSTASRTAAGEALATRRVLRKR